MDFLWGISIATKRMLRSTSFDIS